MCDLCDTIKKSLAGENPFFVKELETGIVILGWNQHFTDIQFLFANNMLQNCISLMKIIAQSICRKWLLLQKQYLLRLSVTK